MTAVTVRCDGRHNVSLTHSKTWYLTRLNEVSLQVESFGLPAAARIDDGRLESTITHQIFVNRSRRTLAIAHCEDHRRAASHYIATRI